MTHGLQADDGATATRTAHNPPSSTNGQPRTSVTALDDTDDIETAPSSLESLSSSDHGRPSTRPLHSPKYKRDYKDRLKVALGIIPKDAPVLRWGHGSLEPRIKALDEYPNGYSKLAAFQDTDENFLIFRKYGWLRNRLLSYYQDRLAELEEELENLDEYDKDNEPDRLRSRRGDTGNGTDPRRKELLEEIELILKTYDELLLRTQQVHAIRRPTRRNQQSVYNFIHNTKAQVKLESEWIQWSDDLVALSPEKEQSWLNGALEDTFRRISRSLTLWLFRTKDQRWRTGQERLMLVSSQRFNYVIHVIITVLATLLLLVPVGLLSEVEHTGIKQIFIILGFTLAFALCCGVFTKARRHETFAATAAYCAVLVVFLSNANNNTQVTFVLENGTILNSSSKSALFRS